MSGCVREVLFACAWDGWAVGVEAGRTAMVRRMTLSLMFGFSLHPHTGQPSPLSW